MGGLEFIIQPREKTEILEEKQTHRKSPYRNAKDELDPTLYPTKVYVRINQ